MKAVSAILFLAGLIAGPGYFIYCAAFSGSSLERVTVFSQDVSSFSAGGMTVQSSGDNAQWKRPVALELTPEMNPLSVQAIVRYLQPAGAMRRRAGYRVELAKNAEAVWVKSFSVSAKKEKKDEKTIKLGAVNRPKTTVHVGTFLVEEAGPYTLDLREMDEHNLTVASLELEVRRNVLTPSKTVLIAAGASLLFGVAGLIVSGRRR